jgi:integrase
VKDLNVAQIKAITKPGVHRVSKGLYLQIGPTGGRSWLHRFMLNGKSREMGLGPCDLVSLAQARDLVIEGRKLLLAGRDPLEERNKERERVRAEQAGKLSFRQCAEAFLSAQEAGWRNDKHRQQWRNTLISYVYPKIGDRCVRDIGTADVLAILTPIWTSKTETASRVRQRVERVLDYATTIKARNGEDPARWKGHLANTLPPPSKVATVEHHAALPWQELPTFMAELATRPGTAADALAFAILTAARSGEVRGMRWREVDLEAKLWTIPPARMKANKEHVVALADAAIAALGDPGGPDDLVFPSTTRAGAPLSDMTLAAVLKRLKRADLTVHGMRSCFRDWAGETTAHPREVIEHALAHRLKDRAEAAYARGTLLAKRRGLMADWARYCTTPPRAEGGNIVVMPARA